MRSADRRRRDGPDGRRAHREGRRRQRAACARRRSQRQGKWRGQTALMWAAAEGHAPVIEALVARGANVQSALERRIHGAPVRGARGSDRRGRGADQGRRRHERLAAGARRASAERRAAPAAPETGPNAFLLAAANAHYELAAWLLDRGADPNAAPQGYTALHQVSWVRKAGIAGSNNPAPQGSGNMDSLTFVRTLVAKGRHARRSCHEATEHGRHHAQLDWRDTVPARRPHRRCTAHEAARRTRRRSAARPMRTDRRR